MIEELVHAQHTDMYNHLQRMKETGTPGIDPLLTDFGVRVKVTEYGWTMLTRQIFNWRIVDARNDPFKGVPTALSGYTRGWCYNGPRSFTRALLAAITWSGMPDTEPSNWIKSVIDERRHGEPTPGIRQE